MIARKSVNRVEALRIAVVLVDAEVAHAAVSNSTELYLRNLIKHPPEPRMGTMSY